MQDLDFNDALGDPEKCGLRRGDELSVWCPPATGGIAP